MKSSVSLMNIIRKKFNLAKMCCITGSCGAQLTFKVVGYNSQGILTEIALLKHIANLLKLNILYTSRQCISKCVISSGIV